MAWNEDELGRKWDRCFADAILKLSSGMLIGGVISLFFFRRKAWPIITGGGFGLGSAYTQCEREINTFVNQAKPACKSAEKKASA